MKYNTIKNIYTTLTLSVGRKGKEEQHPLAIHWQKTMVVKLQSVIVRTPVWEESNFFLCDF